MPKDPRRTATPGYMKDPNNIEYDEQVYISRGLRDKDLKNQVVLNLTEEKIVKNNFNPGKNFSEIFTHYYDSYAEYIDDCINQINGVTAG
jgi:hypothetical protein